MRQMTIFDYLKGHISIGNILDPQDLGQNLSFSDLETMEGATIAVKEKNKKGELFRAVRVLEVTPSDDECSCRRLLYDNGKHICVVLPETGYSKSIYVIRD